MPQKCLDQLNQKLELKLQEGTVRRVGDHKKHYLEINIKGKLILIDEDDFELFSSMVWYPNATIKKYWYVVSIKKNNGKCTFKKLHHLIFGDKWIDHINGNGLDNRKENLRKCTHSENCQNRKKKNNSFCKYKGITYNKKDSVFRAQLEKNGKVYSGGSFKNEEDAAKAYDKLALKYNGSFARLNFKIDN